MTLVTLPFTFALTWRVIWENLGTILVTFVLPKILNFILMKLTKKCIFGPTFIKSRAGHLQHPPNSSGDNGVFGALLGDL